MNDGISFEIPCRNEGVEDISINPICGKPIDYESANLPIPLHIWAAAKPRTYSEVNRGGDVARVWQRRGEWDIALGFVFDGLSPENQEDLDAYRSRVDGNTRFLEFWDEKGLSPGAVWYPDTALANHFFKLRLVTSQIFKAFEHSAKRYRNYPQMDQIRLIENDCSYSIKSLHRHLSREFWNLRQSFDPTFQIPAH